MIDNLYKIIELDITDITSRKLPWEKFAGRRVVITGAGGFLGNYLVRTLCSLYKLGIISKPVKVVAMIRDLERAKHRFHDLISEPDFELFFWNLNSIEVPDIGNTNYVIHAASQASPRFYGSDPVGTLLPNSIGTAALLEALRNGGEYEGFLFVSSSEVYGTVYDEAPLSERDYGVVDPASVRACYAESKRMGETMCIAWHQQYGIPAFIVRPFHTYGPGLSPEDGRVFSDFTYNIVRNENIVMHSDGKARRAFCYASDAITGFFTVLLKGEVAQPYNVANPNAELSIIELAELLVTLFPEKGLSVERHFLPNSTNYVTSTYNRLYPNIDKLLELGWRANVTPAIGFKRMIEALQQ